MFKRRFTSAEEETERHSLGETGGVANLQEQQQFAAVPVRGTELAAVLVVQRPQLHPRGRDGLRKDYSVLDVRGRSLQVRHSRAVLDHSSLVDHSELAARVRKLDRHECRGISRIVSISLDAAFHFAYL